MAKMKKTRKAVVDSDSIDDSVEEEETFMEEKVVKKSGPTHFIAILKKAKTYNLAGRVFMRNTPVEVPIQHLKVFKDNGWFLVNQLK